MPSPPPGPDRIAWIDDAPELLSSALEQAVAMARRDATSRDAPPPPAALRPVLRFTRLPARAMRTVAQVLDRDDEFRDRVAATVTEDEVGRASWIFLARPDGWSEELELLGEAVHEELADEAAARREQSAARRLEQLEAAATQLRSERDGLRRELDATTAELDRDRADRAALAAERDLLAEQVGQLQAARDRAVRELKQAESTAAARLDELRSLRREHEALQGRSAGDHGAAAPRATDPAAPADPDVPGPADTTDEAPGPDPVELQQLEARRRAHLERLSGTVARAAEAAALLGAALAEAAELLPDAGDGPETSVRSSGFGAADRSAGRAGRADAGPDRADRPPRRSPVRLRSGVHEDSPEGIRQLLGLPALVAVVDGYNVTMEGWPTLDRGAQRDSLVAAAGGLQAQVPASIHLVFDGDADGGRPAVGAPLPVRVHFSAADTEADDLILDMVARLPTDVPVLVVSSDRRVAEGARRLGANAVASSVLLELLRR